MINVIVVPETDEFKQSVLQDNVVWINAKLGKPNLESHNVRYLAPFWITDDFRGVNRIFHIHNVEYFRDEDISATIRLGNSFILPKVWNQINQPVRFEYHNLKSFNLIEIKEGLLIPYDFENEIELSVIKDNSDDSPTRTGNPWLDKFGWFKDDPTFDDLQLEIAAYRRELDKEMGIFAE